MKKKRTLYEWFTTYFVVNIRNEENFALRRSIKLNYAQLLVFIVVGLIFISVCNFYLFNLFDDNYASEMRKEKAINRRLNKLSLAVDSLAMEIAMKDSFIHDFKNIVEDQALPTGASVSARANEKPATTEHRKEDVLSDAEIKLREQFQSTELNSKSANVPIDRNLSDILFFSPIDKGLITGTMEVTKGHFGVDLVAKSKEAVKSVMGGTIIFAGYSQEGGNMVILQHPRNLLSVYKHNAKILKKTGDYVKPGEAIAIVGNSGEMSSGPHLHFEMWYRGHPLDPKDYIIF